MHDIYCLHVESVVANFCNSSEQFIITDFFWDQNGLLYIYIYSRIASNKFAIEIILFSFFFSKLTIFYFLRVEPSTLLEFQEITTNYLVRR